MTALSFVLVGAFALAAQTLLLREYLVVHHGNELAIGLFYASWFGWIALSAGLLGARAGRAAGGDERATPGAARARLGRRFGWLLGAYPIALVAQILLIRALRSLAAVPAAEPFPLGALGGWTLLTNAPVSVVTGLIFPVGCALFAAERPSLPPRAAVTRAYALEAIGAVAGGAAVTLLVARGASSLSVALGAGAALAGAALVSAVGRRARIEIAAHAGLLVAALGLLLGPQGKQLTEASIRARFAATVPGAELLESRDTPYQNAAVARHGEELLLLSNGHVVAALPDERRQAMRAALVMTQPAHAERVLCVGLGAVGLLRQLLDYPVAEIVYVEPDRAAFELVARHLGEADRTALSDPRLRLVFGDGRAHISELGRSAPAPFDLVVLALPDPDTAALNRYFTAELYAEARALLGQGGVLATRISSGEHVLGSELASYGASIDYTLRLVFREVVATAGEESWLFGCDTPGRLSLAAAELARRHRALAPKRRLFPAEGFASVLDPERAAALASLYEQRRQQDPGSLANRDDRPVSYFLNLLVLGRQLDSPLTTVLVAIRAIGPWWFLTPVLVLALLRAHYLVVGGPHRARPRFDAAMLLFAVGASSIALQIVLLFAFQSRFGLLFEQLGLVGALFMVGLGLGAALAARLGTPRAGAPRGPARPGRPFLAGALGPVVVVWVLLVAEALLLPVLIGWLSKRPPALARQGYYLSFVATGAASGAAFPTAARLGGRAIRGARRLGALLGAADHWGAAVGALVAGALMVPVAGVDASAGVVAAMLATSLVLVVLSHEPVRTRVRRWLGAARWPSSTAGPRERRRLLSFVRPAPSYLLLGAAAVTVLLAVQVRRARERPRLAIERRRLEAIVPEAVRFDERSSPFWHYAAYAEGASARLNVTLSSLAVADDVTGYGGPLDLVLSYDVDGTIRSVSLRSSEETPSYVAELPQWLRRFEGRRLTEPLVATEPGRARAEHEVDVITGASISSRAALRTIDVANRAVGERLLGLPIRAPPARAPWRPDPEAIYLVVAALVAVAVFLRAPRWTRTALLVSSLLAGGLLLNVQLSLAHVAPLFTRGPPSPSAQTLFVLVLVATAGVIAFGPLYCSLLCPFGAAQELVLGARRALPDGPPAQRRRAARRQWVARIAAVVLGALLAYRAASLAAADPAARLGYAVLLGLGGLCALWGFHALGRSIGHAGVSDALHRRARYLKYALLAAAVSGYAATGSDRVLSFDPLAVAFAAAPDAWTVALMAVLLLFSLDYYRAWCRYLCPVGALLLLGNKLGLLLGLARPKRYRRCDLGVRSREDFDCLQCNRCLDAQASSTRCRARPRWEGSSHGNGKRGLPLVAPEAADHAMARPGGAS